MSKRATALFVVVATSLLSAFDLLLALDDTDGNTYSERIRHWGVQWSWFPYVMAAGFGALLTHWFAKRDKTGQLSTSRRLFVTIGLIIASAIGAFAGWLW